MNWSTLVRVPQDQAAAGAWALQRSMVVSAMACLAIILVMGQVIGRRTAQLIRRVTIAAGTMAAGQFDTRVEVKSQDEIGQLGKAFNEMGEHLQASDVKIKEITNALNKVQAVIEFNLDGTIITANDNFLNTFGYSLDEIKSKHHRMFCEPAYTNSQEYANFWAKLNRGELDSGVSRRLGKGGKEVWIQPLTIDHGCERQGLQGGEVRHRGDGTEEGPTELCIAKPRSRSPRWHKAPHT
jgi:PAS domain S-box-containing protein